MKSSAKFRLQSIFWPKTNNSFGESANQKLKRPKKMSPTLRKVAVLLVIVLILAADCDAKRKRSKKVQSRQERKSKDIAKELERRETNPPNFLRLLIMRLIYGIAAQMNLEERVGGWFNGAFAPPNADYDDYGFGGGLVDELGADDIFA